MPIGFLLLLLDTVNFIQTRTFSSSKMHTLSGNLTWSGIVSPGIGLLTSILMLATRTVLIPLLKAEENITTLQSGDFCNTAWCKAQAKDHHLNPCYEVKYEISVNGLMPQGDRNKKLLEHEMVNDLNSTGAGDEVRFFFLAEIYTRGCHWFPRLLT
jgi:hypothetical protein